MLGIDCVARGRWPEPNTEPKPAPVSVTHEQYISAIRDAVLTRLGDHDRARILRRVKMVYGAGLGLGGGRGVTIYGRWDDGDRLDLVEVCAMGEQSDVQLAGTVVHELGHVIAGHGAGHDKAWKQACHLLGLTTAEASGQDYTPDAFAADLWAAVQSIPRPNDGKPVTAWTLSPGLPTAKLPRPCSQGVGTRGGKSRGPGSGSRLRLYECECPKPVKVRVASDDFDATCNLCGASFARKQ